MANDFVTARNTRNGQVIRLRRELAEHEIHGAELVIVEDGVKSYVPELFKPTTPEEYEKTPRGKREVKKNKTTEEVDE